MSDERTMRWLKLSDPHGENLSYKEIARLEGGGVTVSAIAGAVYRMRQKIGMAGPRNPQAGRPGHVAAARMRVTGRRDADEFTPTVTAAGIEDSVARKTCWHIGGDPKAAAAVFCGHKRVQGRLFCAGHLPIMYKGGKNGQ